MKTLGIIGAGDLGQLIAYHAISDKHYSAVVFFDDTKQKDTLIDGHKVIGGIKNVVESYKLKLFDELIIAIGYKHMEFRQKVFLEMESSQIPFGAMLHSSSYIDKSCAIGKSVVVLPGCCLDRNAVIRDNVLLNVGCTIAHDTKIERHSFLSPRVSIAGFTVINESCVLGINSTIIDNIEIGKNIRIAGGTVVIKSLSKTGLYAGVPATYKKQ